jgi:hypothetical protein
VDPKAERRMKELLLEVLPKLTVDSGNQLNVGVALELLAPLGAFIEKNYGKWITTFESTTEAFISINTALAGLSLLSTTGVLGDLTLAEQRETAADAIVAFWRTIPITYDFEFTLPGVTPVVEAIEIAPGVALKARELPSRDNSLSDVPLGFLFGQPPPNQPQLLSCLVIESAGLMHFSRGQPATNAIRRASIALQLGVVLGAFERTWERRMGATGSYAPRKLDGARGPPQDTGLPAHFENVLGRALRNQDEQVVREQLKSVGVVLRRELLREEKRKANAAPDEWELNRHCARIANAAEWLFDSEGGGSATHFVQLAIAFEALYGGTEKEPVTETLANRVAYSLGTNPAEREELRGTFAAFYGTRSTVVHSGATRLTAEQMRQFGWARSVLFRALKHELALARQGDEDLVLAKARLLAQALRGLPPLDAPKPGVGS